MNPIVFYVAQGLGIVTILLGFINYQVKTREQVLFVHLTTAACFAVHYFLLGALSGMALNILAVVRDIVFYYLGKKGPVNRFWSILFTLITCGAGIAFWDSWYSLLIIAGLMINAFAMSLQNPKHVRISILFTCPSFPLHL